MEYVDVDGFKIEQKDGILDLSDLQSFLNSPRV